MNQTSLSAGLVRIAALLSSNLVALAQGSSAVEWTSFEDRASHAMTILPSQGAAGSSVLMYGGAVPSTSRELADTCQLDSLGTWSQRLPNNSPGPMAGHAMAGIRINGLPAAILVGDSGGAGSSRTWVWDTNNWSDLSTASAPSKRTGHAMVRDSRNNRIILFGGQDSLGTQNDTWVFESSAGGSAWNWRQINTANQPSPRRDHSMAYDPNANLPNGQVVLFGGTGYGAETWRFDGVSWTQSSGVGPAGRRSPAMAYSANDDRVVMFGGRLQNQSLSAETWTFNRSASSWQLEVPTQSPPARWLHAMAEDPSGAVVVHGGEDAAGHSLPATWTWNGASWSRSIEPSRRRGAALTMTATGQGLLFGGSDTVTNAHLGDTWRLVGMTWTALAPAASPSARHDHSMTFDSAQGRSILFGGSDANGELSDMWDWTGVTWSQRFPGAVPPNAAPPASSGRPIAFDEARNRAVLPFGSDTYAYDRALNQWLTFRSPGSRWGMQSALDAQWQRVLMFGGLRQDPLTVLGDTWQWDGVGWQQLQLTPAPSPRLSYGMAFDAARHQLVLYGGYGGSPVYSSSSYLSDTWILDGFVWSQRSATLGVRHNMAMAYDANRQRTVLFGGQSGASAYTNDTWEWDGSTWTQVVPTVSPSPRNSHRMAFDPNLGKMVMFGGYDGTPSALQDTWTYDTASPARTWTRVFPATSPPPSLFHDTCYDPVSGRVLVMGGGCATPWTFTGTTWVPLVTPSAPAWRAFASIAPSTQDRPGILLFGGEDAPSHYQDTWSLQGSSWNEVTSGAPGNRKHFGLTYDASRQRVILFGGLDQATNERLGDTWEWDGRNWLRRSVIGASPPPRSHTSLSYDPIRRVALLFGGQVTSGGQPVDADDTWEWDGMTWTERLPSKTPGPQNGHTMTFDATRAVTVALGPNGTWDFAPVAPARVAHYGLGCAGSAGVASLSVPPYSGLWLGERLEVDLVNRPQGPGLFAWGFSDSLWNGIQLPMSLAAFGSPPQCALWASTEVYELLVGGQRYTSFALPNQTWLVDLGVQMFCQAAYLDAGLPGQPLVTSDALRMTFGAK